jgi:hypothetical protein
MCYDEDSKMSLNGEYVNIYDINVGDVLDTLNGKARVIGLYKFPIHNTIDMMYMNEYVKVTEGHRVLNVGDDIEQRYRDNDETIIDICKNRINENGVQRVRKYSNYFYHLQTDLPCVRSFVKIGDRYCAVWGLYEETPKRCEQYLYKK